jgi:hypothetical protein
MDNRIFNVNGRGHTLLAKAIDLVMLQKGFNVESWSFSEKSGLILYWTKDQKDAHPFPSPLNAAQITPFIISWLTSEQAKKVECKGWDANADHDGDNKLGWRVFCGDWGYVEESWAAIFAVKPAYMWYGK